MNTQACFVVHLFLLLLCVASTSSQAAVFNVNVGHDMLGDSDTRDDVCDTEQFPDVVVGGVVVTPAVPPSGECTLRAAIEQANVTNTAPDPNIISLVVRPTITITRPLPSITRSVIIERAGTTRIEVTGAGVNSAGLRFTVGNNTIRGFVINGFDGPGIYLSGGGGSTITNMYIGTDLAGNAPQFNTGTGIHIVNSPGNTIGSNSKKNVISGNGIDGITISGNASGDNKILGNYIGTNQNGTQMLGNTRNGIAIFDAPNTVIGGTTAGERNIISDNSGRGIGIFGAGATGTAISGNYIGTDEGGTQDFGNTLSGITVDAASDTHVGDAPTGAGNIISGNGLHGVSFQGGNQAANYIHNNIIGLDINGDELPNAEDGVFISNSSHNEIGGNLPALRNIISGNGQEGVQIQGSSTLNIVQGNYIGTSIDGLQDKGNGRAGVFISNASENTVGGTTDSERNTISGNDRHGVMIQGSNASLNTIQGNYIGLDKDGLAPLGNTRNGVIIFESANNTIGGALAPNSKPGNTIAANSSEGIQIEGDTAQNNKIQGNIIGLNKNGTLPQTGTTPQLLIDRQDSGIHIRGAPRNIIGGDTDTLRNIISGHREYGVHISRSTATQNEIKGNYIGTNKAGDAPLPNHRIGIFISNAPTNFIGGAVDPTVSPPHTGTPPGNIISGNGTAGTTNNYAAIYIQGSDSKGNEIKGNLIGTQSGGVTAMENHNDGISLLSGASDTIIGGTAANEANVIANSKKGGVVVRGLNSTGNQIIGNSIYKNVERGIDLGRDQVTPNDDDITNPDQDPGPNELQNFPVITSDADRSAAGTIDGILRSNHANRDFSIEFFGSPNRDSSFFGEGKSFLGRIPVTTDANGYIDFNFTHAVTAGHVVTATATDTINKNTSEFSCVAGMLDLDIDSNNDSNATSFAPQGDAAEDTIENDSSLPGRVLFVNSDDSDGDFIPDFADGYNRDEVGGAPGSGAPEDNRSANDNSFIKITLNVNPAITVGANTKVRFAYSASDPATTTLIVPPAVPGAPAPTPTGLTPAAGQLRIWKKNADLARNPKPVSNNGDYVSAAVHNASTLGLDTSANIELFVEGIRPSEEIGKEQIRVYIDPDGNGPAGTDCGDAVRLTVLKLDLDVDSDRSISIDDTDDDINEENWRNDRGAIIHVNNDDDNPIDHRPDNYLGSGTSAFLTHLTPDTTINGLADRDDMGLLDIQQMVLPPGFSVWLRAKTTDIARVRIFDDRTNAADAEVLGSSVGIPNGAWTEHRIPDANIATPALAGAGTLEFGIEAIEYPFDMFNGMFSGVVDLELVLRRGTNVTDSVIGIDKVRTQVAPFLMLPNTATSEAIYFRNWPDIAPGVAHPFSGPIETVVAAANVRKTPTIPDAWTQDEWELGYSSIPDVGATVKILPTVMDMPRDDPSGHYLLDVWGKRNLMGPVPDVGPTLARDRKFHLHQIAPNRGDSITYGGNLELVPPYTGFDYGRVVYGITPGHVDDSVRGILSGSRLQAKKVGLHHYKLIEPFTDWLSVAHIDEMFAFVPSGTAGANQAGGDWKLAVADTQTALSLLQNLDVEVTGTATTGTATTLVRAAAGWTANQWQNGIVMIIAGAGIGQKRVIASNTGDTLTIIGGWATNPDPTSRYRLVPSSAFSTIMSDYIYTATPPRRSHEDYGTVTAATATSITDSTRAAGGRPLFPAGRYAVARSYVRIVAGAGVGQVRQITAHTGNSITVTPAWAVGRIPNNTSLYVVVETSKMWDAASPAVVTVYDLLHNTALAAPNRLAFGAAGITAHYRDLLAKQPLVQRKLDQSIGLLRQEVGLHPINDLIKLPQWYRIGMRGGKVEERTGSAYWPGSANLQVWNNTILVPDPFGPRDVTGADVFRRDIETKFTALGLVVVFVDSWDYHRADGETHCGTNVRRTPPAGMQQWWNDWPIN